jgi:hypothetical protein
MENVQQEKPATFFNTFFNCNKLLNNSLVLRFAFEFVKVAQFREIQSQHATDIAVDGDVKRSSHSFCFHELLKIVWKRSKTIQSMVSKRKNEIRITKRDFEHL